MRRMIIDTDGLSDDVAAITMACAARDVLIEAVTVVRGGIALDQAVQNVLYTLELCHNPAPVYAGAVKPLLRESRFSDYHGKDGLGDLGLPLYGRQPHPGHAVQLLIDRVSQYPGEMTLVTLGSLTNIALATMLDPSFAGKVGRCVVMGGTGDGMGNVTPVSEANIWMDPEAARVVFESGMNIEMVGWDIAYTDAIFTPADQAEAKAIGNPQACFFVDVNWILMENAMKMNGFAGVDYADPVAMAVALDPSIAHYKEAYPIVITQDGPTRGQVILAKFGHHVPSGATKIKYVTKVDPGSFKNMVFELLTSYSRLAEQ